MGEDRVVHTDRPRKHQGEKGKGKGKGKAQGKGKDKGFAQPKRAAGRMALVALASSADTWVRRLDGSLRVLFLLFSSFSCSLSSYLWCWLGACWCVAMAYFLMTFLKLAGRIFGALRSFVIMVICLGWHPEG